MRNNTPKLTGRAVLSTIVLTCALLAALFLLYQLLFAILYLVLLMVVYDILEALLPHLIARLKDVKDRKAIPWRSNDRTRVIYIGTLQERQAKLYETHMNNPDITSRELYEWQNNIERIERNHASENEGKE